MGHRRRWAASMPLLVALGMLSMQACSGGGGGNGDATSPTDSPTLSPTRTATPSVTATSGPPATITNRPTSTPSATATPTATPNQTPLPSRVVFIAAPSFKVAPRPSFIAAADFNQDGHADVVVSSPRSREVDILFGNADGTFTLGLSTLLGVFPGWLATDDLNGDQLPDIVIADERRGGLFILINNGDSSFAPAQLQLIDGAPFGVAIGDFDQKDGNDLAITDRTANRLTVLLNDGQSPPHFGNASTYPVEAGPEDVFAADFNGDGPLDIVTLDNSGSTTKEVTLFLFDKLNAGAPVFKRVGNFGVGEAPSDLHVADLNGDGRPDLVMLNQPGMGTGEFNLLFARSDGLLEQSIALPIPCPIGGGTLSCRPTALAVDDFNGDGTFDLAVTLFNPGGGAVSDTVRVFGGLGDGSFAPGEVYTTEPQAVAMVAADVTGSGGPDVVIASLELGSVQTQINVSASNP